MNKVTLMALTIFAGISLLIKQMPVGHFLIFAAIVVVGLELSDKLKNLKP